jgi:hypothetical protein
MIHRQLLQLFRDRDSDSQSAQLFLASPENFKLQTGPLSKFFNQISLRARGGMPAKGKKKASSDSSGEVMLTAKNPN